MSKIKLTYSLKIKNQICSLFFFFPINMLLVELSRILELSRTYPYVDTVFFFFFFKAIIVINTILITH